MPIHPTLASLAPRLALSFAASLVLAVSPPTAEVAAAEPMKVKVFIASMFEIGANTGDRAGEFQYWYERYWRDSPPIAVRGALNPVYCNSDGVCGAVLGMGKVSSSGRCRRSC